MLLIFKAFFGSYIFPRNNMEFILFILFCIIFIMGFFFMGGGGEIAPLQLSGLLLHGTG